MSNPWPFWSEKRFPSSYENIYVRASREDWFAMVTVIAQKLAGKSRILDVGSGEGHTTKQILDRIPNVYECDLLEPNKDALATSIPYLKTENSIGGTFCTTFRDFVSSYPYDAVFTSHTNYYWAQSETDYRAQLQKFIDLCKPGGEALMLTLPGDSDHYKLSSRSLFPRYVFSEYVKKFYEDGGFQVETMRFQMRLFVRDIIENIHLLDAKMFYRFVENTIQIPTDEETRNFVELIRLAAKDGWLDFKDELISLTAR